MKKVVICVLFLAAFLVFLEFVIGQNAGDVSLVILPNELEINITHPMNKSYNYSIGTVNFPLALNVTSTSEVESWQYSLYEPERIRGGGDFILGGHEIFANISFVPNTTISAVRFWNILTVRANNSLGMEASDSESFYVYVNNSAPFVDSIPKLYLCEGTSNQYTFLDRSLSAYDEDENDLFYFLEGNIGQCGIFYIDPETQVNIVPYLTNASNRITTANIYNLSSSGIVSCVLNISVGENDGYPVNLAGRTPVNITIIEINSGPNITNLFGVQTLIWGQGENSTLRYDFNATDDESSENAGLISFNVSFSAQNLFGITSRGVVNFTANQSNVGAHNVTICAIDQGLPLNRIHQNISLCGQNGMNQSDCGVFQLTITNENRAPRIVSHYRNESNFSANGLTEIYFNVTEIDPDATIPDTYWYVDGVLTEFDSLALVDEFRHSFACGIGGAHQIKVDSTDGLLNDSFVWNVNVASVNCPIVNPSSGSGGGGGGGAICVPRWGCYDWSFCKNVDSGLSAGEISGEDYREIVEDCDLQGYRGDFCGYQDRTCFDGAECRRDFGKPQIRQSCRYSENPSCEDGISNCHDGACEFLVDCGGPCGACATCSDGLQNQGEGGVDCGGPCPNICPVEQPLIEIPEISIYWKLGILAFLLIFIGIGIKIYIVWQKANPK